jgi:predicted O-methyltransferase YrrM
MPDLAVIVPTRGRPGNIRKVISAWDFTNAWEHVDLILAVDQDDPEIDAYRKLLDPDACPMQIMEFPVWQPMVPKLNAAALALADDYFALGFAGDDHLPRTIDWAKTYLTQLRELGTGMVYGDDGYQGRKLSTEWAVTSDAVRALGRMVPAAVEHLYCDNAIMKLFEAAGMLRHLPQVRIEHMHPVAGKAETDPQYRRVNDRAQYAKDRGIYESWKNGRMSAQLATLKALRPGRSARPATRKEKRMGNRSPFPHHFKQVRGATPEEIGVTLADFASQVPAEQAIVELGVFQGKTALQMAWGARQGNGAHVWAIDAWDLAGNTYGPPFTDPGSRSWARYWIRGLGYSSQITLVRGFSADVAGEWVISPDQTGHGNRPVGLLFVDADHSKEGARRDIEAWAPHLVPGATIAVDDYHHPDWPGVAEAVDELVAEGFLEPIEVFHDRLAVTRLANLEQYAPDGKVHPPVKAITSEGVSPSPIVEDHHPYPAASGQVAVPAGKAETVATGPAITVDFSEGPDVDKPMSNDRMSVAGGELEDVPAGARVADLNTVQLRALAKARGISLGARKDKRAAMLQAIRDGE